METPFLPAADSNLIIQQTKNWILNVVIGCNFCPFAAREMKMDSIRYVVCREKNNPEILKCLLDECVFLDKNEKTATTLVIFPENRDEFDDFLTLLDAAEHSILTEEDYDGIYQLASFHPKYLFAGSDESDAANYTNRSPYPMLHFLRESSIDLVLEHYENPEEIPERNILFARKKGLEQMKNLRAACFGG
jgi:uncharacterized protein